MRVPLLDLKAQYETIRAETEDAVARVFETQRFIGGPEVDACEGEVAAYCGASAAVGVTSGTDALLVSMMAEGIGSGDEVITSPYTFFATGGSISRLGAKAVFVDIDPVTFNIDPGQVERAVTVRTKAIMPIHLYGQTAEMDAIMTVADKHGLVVIEDACQAIGAEYKCRRAGTIGDYGCFSFFPSKNLGGAGDGGMVVFKDESKAEKVRLLRNHGAHPKYYHSMIGGNFRLDAIQAAVVRIKLPHLDAWSDRRRANAERYERLFDEAGLLTGGKVELPKVVQSRHVFNQYIVRVKSRDRLKAHLTEHGIGCEIYYPVPLHLQKCFADLGYSPGDFPASERAAAETLALPVYPELSDQQAAEVVQTIADFYA